VPTDAPTAVVDASVVAKWLLPKTEPFTAKARDLRQRFTDGALSLCAPLHLAYELPSILLKAVGRRELTQDQALSGYELFRQFATEMQFYRSPGLDRAAIRMGAMLRCSFYDALDLALAERLGCPFIHTDARLRRAIAGRSARELWIEDA
jgi:predicted nucleic acid-binding protein